MTPKLALVTTTETFELPMEFIPQSLFSRVIETTMLRNQDETEILTFTDGLPIPHLFEFAATLHFETETERMQYVEWLQAQVNDTQEIIYDNSILLPVSTGWLSYSIGTSNPVQLDVEITFLPVALEWTATSL